MEPDFTVNLTFTRHHQGDSWRWVVNSSNYPETEAADKAETPQQALRDAADWLDETFVRGNPRL